MQREAGDGAVLAEYLVDLLPVGMQRVQVTDEDSRGLGGGVLAVGACTDGQVAGWVVGASAHVVVWSGRTAKWCSVHCLTMGVAGL